MRRLRVLPDLTDEQREQGAFDELRSLGASIARSVKERQMETYQDLPDDVLRSAHVATAALLNDVNERFGVLTRERITRIVRAEVPKVKRVTFDLVEVTEGPQVVLGMLQDDEVTYLPGNVERERIEAHDEWEGLLADYHEAYGTLPEIQP